MKVRITSPFFYPEPISTGKYNTVLARHISHLDHEVEIVCFHPFYPDWKIKESSEQIAGIKILRGFRSIKFPKNQLLRRLLLELAFFLYSYRFDYQNIDVDISILPPSLFAFFTSRRRRYNRHQKRVAIIHDLQGIYLDKRSGLFSTLISKAVRFIEKNALNNQDKLIFVSKEMLDIAVADYGIDQSKCSVHYPFTTINDAQNISGSLNSVLLPQHINITYSGALGEKQNPHALVELLVKLTKDFGNTRAHIFSAGPVFDELKRSNSCEQIFFHDLVSEEHILELYLKSSLQIIPQLSGTSAGSMPSKLPNLVYSGCPILVITDPDSELQQLCNQIPSCIVSTSWNYLAIRELVEKTLSSKSPPHTIQANQFPISELLSEIFSI